MRILIIGGTGFIGPHLVRQLAAMSHEVAVFHRGSSNADLPAEHILGNRADLKNLRPRADVVVDLILSSAAQARTTIEAFRGMAQRVVAASSIDVYRACGVFHGSEEGLLEPVPLKEDSALRSKPQTYPPQQLKLVQKLYPWVDDEYDKIPVERAIMGDPSLPGTICRLPMIYGPGDPIGRFHPIVKRISDDRRAILLQEGVAAWRSPRGYVENVAAAIALATTDDRAAGRIYNVAERPAFSELEWARKIADAMNWTGEFLVLPKDRMPAHLVQPGNTAQHWSADSSRIRRELHYHEPVPLQESIGRTIEWELAHPPREFNPYPFDYEAEDAAIAATV
jgi:nucleoside-diphosphate-sugar epimerase